MKLFIVLIVFLGAVSAGEKETFLKRFRNYLKDVWDDVATITEDAGVVVKFIDSYPLLHAASKGDIEAVEKKLSNKRFHVDFTTPDLTTMLMEASAFGKYDMVKLLIDRGAHVTHSNKYGFTASDYAKKNGHYNIVQLLENKDTEMVLYEPLTNDARRLTSNSGATNEQNFMHITFLTLLMYAFARVFQ